MRRSAVALPAVVTALLLTACASRPRQDVPELAPTRTLAPPATRRPVTPTPQPTATAAVTPTAIGAVADLVGCAQHQPAVQARTPVLPGSAGRVMYLSPDGNLELSDVTGAARERITTDAYIDRENRTLRAYQFPAASPGGDKLAFVRLEVGGGGFTQTLQVADARDGASALDLYESNGFNVPYVDWSPDGKTIAFLTIGGQSGAIRTVSHTGGPVGEVEIGAPTYWHWRADSAGMVTHLGGRAEQPGGSAFMSIVTMNGSERVEGSTLSALPGNFQSPHFSPDGAHVVYAANIGGSDVLVLGDTVGAPVCALARLTNGAFFAWSPNGTHVAVMDVVAPTQQLAPVRVIDVRNGDSTVVSRNGLMFFWSPVGDRLAVYSVAQADASTKLAAPAADAPGQTQPSLFMRIESVDIASGKALRIADTNPTANFVQYIQFFDQYSRAVSPWSADGRHLAFTSSAEPDGEGEVGVATFDAAHTSVALTRIGAGTLAFFTPK